MLEAPRSPSVPTSLDEEAVQEPKEEWDHDEEHERRQIAEDEDQHEPSFDATGGVQAPRALRSAKAIAMIAEYDEGTTTEVASSFEIACEGGETC
jgi:hypothetical protein